ncbi:gamma subunit of adaptor protein complex AP-1 [Chloropicon primus]|uniref:AP-1 complex subunit gamma n=1 Tax=Chloropicon primus TaxID=1764295 RepID=A0A5B8MG00_9CHLO|nr:gamma subunit of adaptor protein complex AP-1 [Chloropicon primus]UPQ98332.1 gamma subunit of adaptor protein complex AP-1 [Chloropicon primus]|eukprot:QDZ19124.1 gamma subunit of adaptor protein complex AP-1 [Chloropicon primus]
MTTRVREFIKQVRDCKTAAEERAVIAKESAALRTLFKQSDGKSKAASIAKLVYLHMLGYPTHFGQMECLKLIAGNQNSYAEKRIGYLGLMSLLDETQEILMLLTNSLKVDLNAKNDFVVRVALGALGNLCSTEMARDLSTDVRKLMLSKSHPIQEKAVVCAIRLIQKCPELAIEFKDEALALLDLKNNCIVSLHGTMLLAVEICRHEPEAVSWYAAKLDVTVRILRKCIMQPVARTCFIQQKILYLMRVIGKGNTELTDRMSDVLAEVASKTDPTRTAGSSVLYECVLTIIETGSVGGLRVLAVNILGKFLGSRDSNLRFAALQTLKKVVDLDANAVLRHKAVIMMCIKDTDISIRRKALELAFELVSEKNVEVFMSDFLGFLDEDDPQFKTELVGKICLVVETFAPTPTWYIDIMTEVLLRAGKYVNESAFRSFAALISTATSDQGYAVKKLFSIISYEPEKSNEVLLILSLWCIGEFALELTVGEDSVTSTEIVSVFERVMRTSFATKVVIEYALTALVKLSDRYPAEADRIKGLILAYNSSTHLEIQQRSCEFNKLFNHGKILPQVLESMPPILNGVGDEDGLEQSGGAVAAAALDSPAPGAALGSAPADPMGDLLNMDVGGPSASGSGDVLADLLGGGGSDPAPPAAAAPAQPQASDPLMDLLGGGGMGGAPATPGQAGDMLADMLSGPASTAAPAAPAFPSITPYQKDGIAVEFSFEKDPNQTSSTVIQGKYSNAGPAPVSNFVVQCAVPKYLQLRMEPASGNALAPQNATPVSQRITVNNTLHGQKPLMMRLKLDFSLNGVQKSEMVEVRDFPSGL